MIKIDEKKKCTGCSACASICPKNCIRMESDEEGFLYPKINSEKCIECRLCESACSMINPVKEESIPQQGFLVQHRNEAIRLDSSSGGAFTAIASAVIDKGGVVFGAAYDDSFHVRHIYVETIDALKKFRNSKYVQSVIGESFRQAKSFLNNGKWVCFSGTPCQIEGLSKFFEKAV